LNECSRCYARRTPRSPRTGRVGTRPTWRSLPPVAEVVRDLWRRDRERGLSAGEKRMLAKARQILVSELALAEKTNEDKAEALLDEVLTS
jgi:RNA polymerase-interacting CarD/CdnL/TRCF family regulator